MKNNVAITIREVIGARIRMMRHEHNLTTKELSKLIGVSQQQLSRYERAVNKIDVDILYKISCVFECSVNDFFRDVIYTKIDDECLEIYQDSFALIDG
ncbi:TPA: helix-turn-helix transcriptional regulator [Morganella morganii]|nr:helix-turn-helix transcriptional regulator [Morganella morganii]